MKNRNSRVIATILALILVIGSVFGIGMVAMAEDEGPSLGQANVVYGDQISLVFTVDGYTGSGTVGVAVFRNEGDTTPAFSTFEKQIDKNGVEYYEIFGIAAKDIDTDYYVAVAEADENGAYVKTLSTPIKYSVAAYVNARLETVGISDAQRHLYNTILAYNKAADAVLTVAD